VALRIDGNAVAWETRQEVRPSKLDYTFTVDPGSDPARIRLTGGARGATMLASYAVEGDQLKLCLSWDNQSHPRRLSDDYGRLYVFQRQEIPWAAPDDPSWKDWARKRQKRQSVLQALGKGYVAASKKGGPPKGFDDLQSFLQGAAAFKEHGPAKTLEACEILYGVDLRAFRPEDDGQLLAWEKTSDEDGGRFALTLGWLSTPGTEQEAPPPGELWDGMLSVRYLNEDLFRQSKKAQIATPAPPAPPKAP
jgi:hypothetical protein